jgi:hypothetical protein
MEENEMTIEQIIALVRTLEDVIKADEDVRVKAYGTEYKRISGLVADRIVEELYRLQPQK